ncbi:hypothetical protein P3W33_18020 [Luteibacter sp. PPL552]
MPGNFMKKHTVNDDSAQPWVDRFGEIPVIEASIYAINPEIPTDFLFSEARCMLDAMSEVAGGGVETPMSGAAAWMLERNLRCVEALLRCIETQVNRSKAGLPVDHRLAA